MTTILKYILLLLSTLCILLIAIGLKQYKMITYDQLTGLVNYTAFKKRAEKKLKKAEPNEYMIALIDIDDFKYINQTFSVATGDKIIQIFSEFILEQLTRQAGKDWLLTRKGGDKFMLLFKTGVLKRSNPLYGDQEKMLGEYIRQELQLPIQLKYSIGVVPIIDPSQSLLIYIGQTHIVSQRCKDYYCTHLEVLSETIMRQFLVEKDIVYGMYKELFNKELIMFLQPKYELKTGKMIGAEALVRWMRKGAYMYSPDQFIPVFEKYYFIKEMDLFMFEEVCIETRRMHERHIEGIRLSVNLSRITLMSQGIDRALARILDRYQLKGACIEIEITESAMANSKEMIEQINKLRALGFKVSLDDFGAGQSALANLNWFDIDIVKLDRSFLQSATHNKGTYEMMGHLIKLIHSCGFEVVAEGVETAEDVAILKELGCDMVQGYYFARPMSLEQFYKEVAC